MTEDSVDFVIDFFGNGRTYVKECVWADNQKLTDFENEHKTRIEFSTTQCLKVKEWVLSQGANVVPQSPKWFVEDWKKTILEMSEQAQKIQ